MLKIIFCETRGNVENKNPINTKKMPYALLTYSNGNGILITLRKNKVRKKAGEEMTLEELQNSSFVVGMKETERALEKGEALHVFIAADCDERISAPLKEACSAKDVPVTDTFTKKEIGKACGIKVKAATAAIVGRP